MNLNLLFFALGFVPGIGPFMPTIQKAWPYIEQYLPVAVDLIGQGVEKVQAFNQAHPALISTLRGLAEDTVAPRAGQWSDAEVVQFAAPLIGVPWTQEDTDRWMNKASNPGGG